MRRNLSTGKDRHVLKFFMTYLNGLQDYSIRTPDAIQIAVGIIYGADTFLTNDSNLDAFVKSRFLDNFVKCSQARRTNPEE